MTFMPKISVKTLIITKKRTFHLSSNLKSFLEGIHLAVYITFANKFVIKWKLNQLGMGWRVARFDLPVSLFPSFIKTSIRLIFFG